VKSIGRKSNGPFNAINFFLENTMSNWKTLKILNNRIEADIVAGLLNENEIMTNIIADDLAGTHPELDFSQGVKLQVPDDDYEKALKLIQEKD
jgi:hypothetical protein